MNFAFSDEQELLRGQARDFLDRESSAARVRTAMETAEGYDAGLYRRMADLGWTAIPYPEEYGGLGLGLTDAVVVLEEVGRHVTPSPLHSSHLAGMIVLEGASAAQKQERLPAVCGGGAVATLALVEESGHWGAPGVAIAAQRSGDTYLLSGTKLFVPDAHAAGWMIVAARSSDDPGDGLTLLLVDAAAPGVQVRPMVCIDQTQRLHEVTFDNVEVAAGAIVGGEGRGWATLQRGVDRALIGISADLCGTAQRAMEMSVEYARTRQQFGRPIGAYQAVSHMQLESARSLTYYAAWAVDNDVPEAPMAASMAKAYAGDAARSITANAVQVHGGIGFSWEHDLHLYFKHAVWGETTLGDSTHHRERVARFLEL